jgi:membrane complex biogenesis BtpA family protein
MGKFKELFEIGKPLIGMVHVGASPGTFGYKGDVKVLIEQAIKEAKLYKETGIQCLMIENMHDQPYLNRIVGHEVSTLMSIIGYEIKQKTQLYCGVQILAGADLQSLATAHSAGLDFIRSECFVFSHVADEGLMHSNAGELKRYQKQIGAEDVLIFTDIKKKHSSHALTSDIDILEAAEAAEFFLSDGIILTGASTGKEANVNEAELLKTKLNIPVLIGSGITVNNLTEFFPFADGFIVGSFFKETGLWKNSPDKERIRKLVKKYEELCSEF